MKAVVGATVALLGVLFSGALGLILVVVVASSSAGSAALAVAAMSNPSDEAMDDVPALLLDLFIREAQQCTGLPWTVMAGISKVESNHGRFGGAVVTLDGTIRPPIIGIPLNGSNSTARIPDTDDGHWDGDTVWDRAVGPFQFIPSSWRIFGGDGNNDGMTDPNNVHDAVPAMRRHLCPDGQIVDIETAVFGYNRSTDYVEAVLDWARRYTRDVVLPAVPADAHAPRRHRRGRPGSARQERAVIATTSASRSRHLDRSD